MCVCIVAGIALAATSIAYYRILGIIAATGREPLDKAAFWGAQAAGL